MQNPKMRPQRACTGAPVDPQVFFDVNVRLGPAQRRSPDVQWRTGQIVRELARCGIGSALCRSALGPADDPGTATAALLAEIRHRPGLYAAGTITPSLLDQFPPESEQWARLAEADIRAAAVWPKAHKVGFSPWVWQGWAEQLAPRRFPVLIDFGELPGPNEVDLIRAWLKLLDPAPVILLDAGWSASNLVLRLMEACPNLHMDMATWQAHNCAEFLVRHFGPRRILFGSGQPEKAPGAARAAVDYAELPVETRAAIAGGNLQSLLGLEALTIQETVPAGDSLAEAARAGRPLPALVADAHAHVMGREQHMVQGMCFPDCSPDRQMKINRRMGMDIQCQASWTGPVSAAARIGNDILLESQKMFPDIVVPMATVDPSQMTPEEMTAEIDRLFTRGPAAGLKPYHSMGIPYHDSAWAPFFEYGNAHRLFALLHPLGNLAWAPGSPQAKGYVEIAERYPDLSILIAHSGGSFPYARTAVWIARQQPNVFLELTLTPVPAGIIEWLVAEIGADRILFGTDAPMRDPRPQLGWVVHADISERDKRKILGINFCRILARAETNCPAVERARSLLAAEDRDRTPTT